MVLSRRRSTKKRKTSRRRSVARSRRRSVARSRRRSMRNDIVSHILSSLAHAPAPFVIRNAGNQRIGNDIISSIVSNTPTHISSHSPNSPPRPLFHPVLLPSSKSSSLPSSKSSSLPSSKASSLPSSKSSSLPQSKEHSPQAPPQPSPRIPHWKKIKPSKIVIPAKLSPISPSSSFVNDIEVIKRLPSPEKTPIKIISPTPNIIIPTPLTRNNHDDDDDMYVGGMEHKVYLLWLAYFMPKYAKNNIYQTASYTRYSTGDIPSDANLPTTTYVLPILLAKKTQTPFVIIDLTLQAYGTDDYAGSKVRLIIDCRTMVLKFFVFDLEQTGVYEKFSDVILKDINEAVRLLRLQDYDSQVIPISFKQKWDDIQDDVNLRVRTSTDDGEIYQKGIISLIVIETVLRNPEAQIEDVIKYYHHIPSTTLVGMIFALVSRIDSDLRKELDYNVVLQYSLLAIVLPGFYYLFDFDLDKAKAVYNVLYLIIQANILKKNSQKLEMINKVVTSCRQIISSYDDYILDDLLKVFKHIEDAPEGKGDKELVEFVKQYIKAVKVKFDLSIDIPNIQYERPADSKYNPPSKIMVTNRYLFYITQVSKKYSNACSGMSLEYKAYNGSLEKTFNLESFVFPLMSCDKPIVCFYFVFYEHGTTGHANAILVNKAVTPWEIERFEPHGGLKKDDVQDNTIKLGFDIDDDLSVRLPDLLKKFGIDAVYKRPIDICPGEGPQTIAERSSPYVGFCQSWTILYMEMRMHNPSRTGTEIIKELLKLNPKHLTLLIQNMAYEIWKVNEFHFTNNQDIEKLYLEFFFAECELPKLFEHVQGAPEESKYELYKAIRNKMQIYLNDTSAEKLKHLNKFIWSTSFNLERRYDAPSNVDMSALIKVIIDLVSEEVFLPIDMEMKINMKKAIVNKHFQDYPNDIPALLKWTGKFDSR